MQSYLHWFPGHISKGIREIDEKIKLIDFLVLVVDSRAPWATLNENIKRLIDKKNTIFVFTKYDMAQKEALHEFLSVNKEVFRDDRVIKCNLKDTSSMNKVRKMIDNILVQEGARHKRVMIIGAPNVGKSTLINALANRKAAIAQNKPGVTRRQQWITTGEGIQLIDTPGIIDPRQPNKWLSFVQGLISSIKVSPAHKDDLSIFGLEHYLKQHPEELKRRYRLSDEEIDVRHSYELFDAICLNNGFFHKGKKPDYDRAITHIIKDIQDGKICPTFYPQEMVLRPNDDPELTF